MALSSRMFSGSEDQLRMHDLIVAAWRVHGARLTFHVGDLHWRLRPQPRRVPERDLRLWFDAAGALQAFAWFEPDEWADVQCHPAADRERLEPELFEWLEELARGNGANSLTVGGFEGDAVRSRILEGRGYVRTSSHIHHTVRALEEAPRMPELPDGYEIRSTREEDLAAQGETIALAFGTEPKPAEAYRKLRAGPAYRNDLDLIVATPDGTAAAFCIAWLDPENAVGLLEPVGCHPEHRRRGLAAAAVRAALARLRAAGARTAVVCPMSTNPAAVALYSACGFETAADDYDWTRSLS